MLEKPEISTGLMSHLAPIQTWPLPQQLGKQLTRDFVKGRSLGILISCNNGFTCNCLVWPSRKRFCYTCEWRFSQWKWQTMMGRTTWQPYSSLETTCNRLTKTCSRGLQHTSLILAIHVTVNRHLSKHGTRMHWLKSLDHWPSFWFLNGLQADARLTCCNLIQG